MFKFFSSPNSISMKIHPMILVFLFQIPLLLSGQNSKAVDAIIQAFTNGKADMMSAYFNNIVDLELEAYDDNFSKKQCMVILQKFFNDHPSKGFSINHDGSSDDGSKYLIATYRTASGNYRVYFLLKMKEGQFLIYQLQFEDE